MSKKADNKFLRAFGVQGVNKKNPSESSPSARATTAMQMPMQYQLESSRHRTNRAGAAAQADYDDGEPDINFVDETEPLCDQYPDTEQHRYCEIGEIKTQWQK